MSLWVFHYIRNAMESYLFGFASVLVFVLEMRFGLIERILLRKFETPFVLGNHLFFKGRKYGRGLFWLPLADT